VGSIVDGGHELQSHGYTPHRSPAALSATEEEDALRRGLEALALFSGACIITLHPQIVGRTDRLAVLDDFIGCVEARDNAWITSCAEIASRVRYPR
jgi:peptidoglycan/xylan/chitin deacetylase (PgdA/CDA1 family)